MEEKIPNGVVNEEYYLKWKLLNDEYQNDPNNPYETSIPGLKINMLEGSYKVNRDLAKLPEGEEKEKLKQILKLYNVKRGKLIDLKMKAFGTRRTSPAEKPIPREDSSILSSKKTEILELFGKFYNIEDVHRILTEQYDFIVPISTLTYFRQKHINQITELQEKYKRDYTVIRLTHKKSRLEELNYLYQDRKSMYLASKNREDYKLLLMTLKDIKTEVEGDILTINGNIDINIEQTINFQVQQELIKGLAIKDIIISRVSARLGINPNFLLQRLHSSYYSSFNGYGVPAADIQNEQPIYPSQIVYNFDEIRNKAAEKKEEQKKLEQIPSLEDDEKTLAQQLQNDLISLIKQKREAVANLKEGLNEVNKEEEYNKEEFNKQIIKDLNSNIEEIDFESFDEK
jgi:hypothetical protein